MADNENDIEISPADARAKFEAGEVQLVDVREQSEWDVSRIPGDVKHIPLGELQARAGEIPTDKPVVFQCRSGGRSSMAAQAFRAAGIEAYNLTGGLLDWNAQGLPVEPAGAPVAEH
ncbi:MAG TPA: rhodanese-like domain-containing protein [Baekduia sp.]|uniref:rhodanese-like domain-containing protein n=1 Tax=Baekduia sp. TaxID=2600305 RepID=UPI002D770DB5|nr:rhodanese-like domain-containing protein [Baekduia sp.]HET6506565.1 rhodanese-like domain-containing protein [Baekduia sp.]